MIKRWISASVLGAGLIAGMFACPAHADDGADYVAPAPPPAEFYQFNWVGGTSPTTWAVTHCGVQCLHIAETGGQTEPWEADAYALNGYWTMFVNRLDFITCDDGRKVAAAAQYNWDENGNGMVSAVNSGECGDVLGPISANFTLTPLASPAP